MDRRLLLASLALLVPAAAQAGEEKKKGGGATFIQMTTLTATVTYRSGLRGVMTMEAGLDVPDQSLHDRALMMQPRVRAGCLDILRTYAGGMPSGSIPNADYLAQAMQREVDRQVGRPGARLLVGTILVS